MVKERRIDLSKYRFERAKEEIDASKELQIGRAHV